MRLKSEKWPLDPELLEKIKINLFAEAHPAIEEWDRFPWHPSRAAGGTDAWQPNSSQALAIDVFGTLKLASRAARCPRSGRGVHGLPDRWSLGSRTGVGRPR